LWDLEKSKLAAGNRPPSVLSWHSPKRLKLAPNQGLVSSQLSKRSFLAELAFESWQSRSIVSAPLGTFSSACLKWVGGPSSVGSPRPGESDCTAILQSSLRSLTAHFPGIPTVSQLPATIYIAAQGVFKHN